MQSLAWRLARTINTLEAGEDIIQRHLDKVLPALFKRVLSLVPVWRFVKRDADRELEASVLVIKQTIEDYVAQARARLVEDPSRLDKPSNLLEAMVVSMC
jgi:hypothetical protein